MTDQASDKRLREAFSAPLQIAAAGAHCPPTAQLWEAAHGELDRDAVAEILLHCGECGACAEGWRLASAGDVDVVTRADRDDATGPARATRPLASRFRLIAAAAAMIAIVGLAVLMLPKQPSEPSPVFRGAESVTIQSTTGDAALPRDRCLLSWTSAADGARYDLRVTTEDLEMLHVAWDLEQPSFLVPSEALRSVDPGSKILWQVTIRSPEGDTDVSETFSTVVD